MSEICYIFFMFLIYGIFWSDPEAGFQMQSLKKLCFDKYHNNLTKTENRPKKYLIQLSHYCFE